MTKLFVLEYSDTSYIVVNDILITNVYAEDFDMGMSLETFTGTLKATLNAAGVSTVMVKLDANPFFAEHLGSEPDAEGEFLAEWLRENPGQLEAKVLLAQSEFRQRLCLEAGPRLTGPALEPGSSKLTPTSTGKPRSSTPGTTSEWTNFSICSRRRYEFN